MSHSSPREPAPGAAIARQLKRRGVRDARLLRAFAGLSRARFMPPEERDRALDDCALPIGLDQTISQPFVVAVMTDALALSGGERVLEIGTGSGYQTAILSELTAEVFTIERLPLLSLRARGLLDGLGRTNIRFRTGDGTLGWPEEAPFDRILITAGAPVLPPPLFDQLAEDGLLVAPLGDAESQELTVVRKQRGREVRRGIMSCRFVKLIGAEGWTED